METVKTKKKSRLGVIAAVAAPVALALLFLLLSPSRGFANFVTAWFSRPVKALLGTVFGVIPLSVMELEYIAAFLFILIWNIRTVALAIRREDGLRLALRRTGVFLLVIAYLLVFFLWCFAIDYRSDSFSERSGLEAGPVETEDLYVVTKYFVQSAAQYASEVKRDGDLHWAEELDGYLGSSKYIYENLNSEFPFLSARSRVPKKMYLTSRISSWMGFTGVYFPFSGESNINIEAPGPFIPQTICHELAHQKGVYAEQEANFVGIAAALAAADAKLWRELGPLMSDEMRTDWNDNHAYWQQFEGKVEEVSSKVYDGYLKAQGQELGIRSYGACVDLLVTYYADMAHAGGTAE